MVFQKQYSAGPEVDRAVGEAIEKYMSVLDAEYTDHDCWVDHCPRSSKSIPGVPADRALFTTQERANLEGHRGRRAMDRGPVSRVRLYSVAQQPDGMGLPLRRLLPLNACIRVVRTLTVVVRLLSDDSYS